MATKRKTADQAQDITTTDAGTATLTEQPPATDTAAETASQAAAAVKPEAPAGQESATAPGSDGKYHTMREPGEDTRKSWVKRASIIVDPEAGVKFHFDYEKHQGIITFDEKPTQELLAVARPILNENGFEWDKVNKDGWKTKKIQFLHRENERRQAKKTFYALANALREQKGLPARTFGEALAF